MSIAAWYRLSVTDARWPVVLVIVLMVTAVPPGSARAQGPGLIDDSTFATASGQTITWTAPWTFAGEVPPGGAAGEAIVLTDGTASVAVATGTAAATDVTRDAVLAHLGVDIDAVTVLDAGADGTVAYQFARVPVDGADGGTFSVATTAPAPVLTLYLSPIATFAAGLAQAQDGIAVDGEPIFAGVDGGGLQLQLEASPPSAAATSAPGTGEPTAVPTSPGSDTVIVAGATIVYGPPWTYLAAQSIPDVSVHFASQDGEPPVFGYDVILDAPPGSVAFVLEQFTTGFVRVLSWTDVQQLAAETLPSGRAWSLHTATIPLGTAVLLTYAEPGLADGDIRLQTLVAVTTDFDAALRDAQGAIAIDGVRAFDELDASTVVAALQASTAAAPTPEGTAASARRAPRATATAVPYAEAGLVAPGHWVSPNTGAELRWDATAWPLDLDPVLDAPVASAVDGDELHVVSSSNELVFIGVFISPAYGATMDDVIGFYTSSDVFPLVYGPSAEIVLSTSTATGATIVARDSSGFGTMLYYTEYTFVKDGAGLVEVRFTAPLALAEAALADAQTGITLNGQAILTTHSVAEVLAAAQP